MKIENRTVDIDLHYLSPVTYIPNHADGNAGHQDCEQGVIISFNDNGVKVLYSKTRTVQSTNFTNLVWG